MSSDPSSHRRVSELACTCRILVPAELDGERLDRALEILVEGTSRARLQKMVRRGCVRISGRVRVRSNLPIRRGEVLELALDEPARGDADPAEELRVVYEDADLAVIDKPAGLISHPNERFPAGTVADLAEQRYGPLPTALGEHRPGIVHRLDRETSGLMILARTREAMLELQRQFMGRRIQKTYLSLVHGEPRAERFEVDESIGPDGGHPDRQRLSPPGLGLRAVTKVEVLEAFDGFAYLACRPKTGRRHQLRVHLASRGLPMVTDRLYQPAWVRIPDGAPMPIRQALHAHGLELEHPTERRPLSFESPLPADLSMLLEWLRRNRS